MEQKITQRSKRATWSVYVFVERQVQEGRSMLRRKRLNQTRPDRYLPGEETFTIKKFLYLNVTKIYYKKGNLYVQIGVGKKKEMHVHEMKSVVGVQTREHDRSGRVQ
jgi:hypothetical protein